MPKIVLKTTENIIYVGDLLDSSTTELRISVEQVKNTTDNKIPDYIMGIDRGYRGSVTFNKSQLIWYYKLIY